MLRERIEVGVDAPKLLIGELPGDLKIAAGEAGAILVRSPEGAALELKAEDEGAIVHLSVVGDGLVEMPASGLVEVQGVRGDAKISGIQGSIRLEEVSGDLAVQGAGSVEVGAVYGDLRVRDLSGDLDVRQVHGNASVRAVDGRIDLPSVGADVNIKGSGAAVRVVAGADLKIDHAAGEESQVELSAGADIKLRLAEDANATVQAHSGAGAIEVSLDTPAELHEEGHAARVVLGEGSGSININAGGAVRIAQQHASASASGPEVWAEMGEEFRNMADRFTQHWEENVGMMGEQLNERLGHLSKNLPEVLTAAGLSMEEAERVASKVRTAGERAAAKAQRKVERAVQQAERRAAGAGRRATRYRHGSRAERSKRAAGSRSRKGGPNKKRWVYFPDGPNAATKSDPVSSEERLTVLRMVEAGTITADDAARLLSAMEGNES